MRTEAQTEGRTDMTKLRGTLHYYAKGHKNIHTVLQGHELYIMIMVMAKKMTMIIVMTLIKIVTVRRRRRKTGI
jgi:hypothetical protein